MKYRLGLILMICSSQTYTHWTELTYDTPAACFSTGIKRVFIPFPGFGTYACVKDTIKQMPEYKKSAHLLAGHITGLVATGCITFAALIVGLNGGIPGCRQVLGDDLAQYFKIKSVIRSCE